jgi:hypothetical protein
MSRHRLERTRPRYGRIAVAGFSVAVTSVALLGGIGVLPGSSSDADERDKPRAAPTIMPSAEVDAGLQSLRTGERRQLTSSTDLPEGSGVGRRVVFSETLQRVWLVDQGDAVARTYPVSGSAYDNLDPGSYAVFSRSERAWGIDDSGTMRWFVRFAEGPNAAIGFHSIPELNGEPVQTVAQLGTPLSHGCIRQKMADARALWEFAPVGTTVVVL